MSSKKKLTLFSVLEKNKINKITKKKKKCNDVGLLFVVYIYCHAHKNSPNLCWSLMLSFFISFGYTRETSDEKIHSLSCGGKKMAANLFDDGAKKNVANKKLLNVEMFVARTGF